MNLWIREHFSKFFRGGEKLWSGKISSNKNTMTMMKNFFFFPIYKLHRYSRVKGRHYRKFAVCSLSSAALPGHRGLLQLPDEAAPSLQLPGDSLFWRRSGLHGAPEGGPHIHHGKVTNRNASQLMLTASVNNLLENMWAFSQLSWLSRAQGCSSLWDWCSALPTLAGAVFGSPWCMDISAQLQREIKELLQKYGKEKKVCSEKQMFSFVSRFRVLPCRRIYLFDLNLQYDLHTFLTKKWGLNIANVKMQTATAHSYALIQHKENSKADFKVRHT